VDEAKIDKLIKLTDSDVENFRYSNARFFVHELFQQAFVYHLDPAKFNEDFYEYQKSLERGDVAEKYIAELPSQDTALDAIILSIKAPLGSASDAFLKADLINVVIPDSSNKFAS
jgi:hypothetical protein